MSSRAAAASFLEATQSHTSRSANMDEKNPYPLYPQAVLLPLLSLLALLLNIAPLAWHIRNRNLAAVCLVVWINLSNLMNAINAFIWPTDDMSQWWSGWGLCDIEAKLMVSTWIGVIGALLCILRHLAHVLNTEKTVLCPSRAQRHRKLAIELFFCIGLPIWMMIAHYIVQPNRYYIFAISGCTVSVDNSWPKFVLIFIWPLIFSLFVVYYSVLIIVRMHRYRRDFSTILSSSSSNLTKHRFLRLLIMATTLIIVILPVQIYILYENSTVPLLPYSWNLIHPQDWSPVFYPAGGSVIFDRWIQVSFGFIMFLFFGLGHDAQEMYRHWLVVLGFARCCPCLARSKRKKSHTSTQSSTVRSGTFASRSRLLVKRMTEKSGSVATSHNRSRAMSIPSDASSSPGFACKQFSIFSPMPEHEMTFENQTLPCFVTNATRASTVHTLPTTKELDESCDSAATLKNEFGQSDTKSPLASPRLSEQQTSRSYASYDLRESRPMKSRGTETKSQAPQSFFERFLINAHRSAPARRLGGMSFTNPVRDVVNRRVAEQMAENEKSYR